MTTLSVKKLPKEKKEERRKTHCGRYSQDYKKYTSSTWYIEPGSIIDIEPGSIYHIEPGSITKIEPSSITKNEPMPY